MEMTNAPLSAKRIQWIYYFLGLFIMPLGVILMINSRLGPPPLASLSAHVAELAPITLGTASFFLQALIVGLVMVYFKEVKSVLIFVAATLLGFGLDFWDLIVLRDFYPEGLPSQFLSFFGGLFIISFGQNLVRFSMFKATPLLEYMKFFQALYKTERIFISRLSVEGSILVISFIVAYLGGLGLGNIALGTFILLVGMPGFLALQNLWMAPIFAIKKAS